MRCLPRCVPFGLAALSLLASTTAPAAATPNNNCNADGGHAHISIGDAVANEDAGTMTFTITCHPCGRVNATSRWQTSDGSATAGADYVAITNMEIVLGTTSADTQTESIVVTINDDTVFEGNETFTVGLTSAPANPSVGPPCLIEDDMEAVGTIVEDDPVNTPPNAEAGGPYSVPEGGNVTVSGAGSSDPDSGPSPLTYAWDFDNDGMFDDAVGVMPSFSAAGRNGPSSQAIALEVSDGAASDSDGATVNISNVAPTIQTIVVSSASIDEGGSVTVSGTFTDPGSGEAYSGTAVWSDGPATPLTVGAGTFSTTRAFADDHPATNTASDVFTVTVTISDSDGGSDSEISPAVTVHNVAPTVDTIALSSTSIDEGAPAVTVSGTFSDPALGVGTETFSGTAQWSDGQSTPLTVGSGTFSTSRAFADDHPATGTPSDVFTVEITIDDDDQGSGSDTSGDLTVNNLAPTVDAPVVAAEPSNEGSAVTATATFGDAAFGVATESFDCTVDYGDGEGPGSGAISGDTCTGPAHTYADNGSYDVTVEATDDDTGVGDDTSAHQVLNVAPTITATTNSAELCGATAEGVAVDVSADFTDPGFDNPVAGTMEDFDASTIDWGDSTVDAATVAETPGGVGVPTTGTVSGSHVYASGGIFTITITVEDDDGGTDTETLTALVTGAGLTPAGLLGVVGTDGLDVVNIQTKGADIEVQSPILGPGKAAFPTADVVSMQVVTCDGNDQIHVNRDVAVPAILDGGPGDDHVRAGSGLTQLVGGSGDDHLFAGDSGNVLEGESGNDDLDGGKGDDLLFGGPGEDKLAGKQGDDLLDGGPGVDDCNPGKGSDVVVNCEP